jgi:hypothetical protein
LPQVRAPTLLITFEDDIALTKLNRAGLSQLFCEKSLEIVPSICDDDAERASQAGRLARAWFERYLVPSLDD